MIISHKHKFIFIHINRCGGTAIAKALLPYLDAKDVILGYTPQFEKISEKNKEKGYLWKHSRAIEVRKILGENVWDNYFKFSFVRNPYDRIVSTYHWWIENGENYRPDITKKIAAISFRAYLSSRYFYIKPCGYYIDDGNGNIIVDFIGKFENINEDFGKICNNIGFPIIGLTRQNLSRRSYNRNYYNNYKAKQIISNRFRKDIEFFGYDL